MSTTMYNQLQVTTFTTNGRTIIQNMAYYLVVTKYIVFFSLPFYHKQTSKRIGGPHKISFLLFTSEL